MADSESHRRLAVGASVLVLGTVIALGVALPDAGANQRPALRAGEAYGVDVSHHQGDIDWAAVRSDDIRFAYAKASEGRDMRDDRFKANYERGRAAGVSMGAYHFFSLCRTGSEQAANFLGALADVGATDADLPPVVDLEFNGNCEGRPAASDLDRELTTFIDQVERATGKRVTLYVLDTFEAAYPLPSYGDHPRWERRLDGRPSDPWVWWQTSETAEVAGIAGGVDLDVVRPG